MKHNLLFLNAVKDNYFSNRSQTLIDKNLKLIPKPV